jgi:hypothetical protein
VEPTGSDEKALLALIGGDEDDDVIKEVML